VVKQILKKTWNLPVSFPNIELHALLDDLGLNVPSVWKDYCGADIRALTQMLNDEGPLGSIARASLQRAAIKFRH
jgi:hypothetical protein